MLYREIIAVHLKNHTENLSTLTGKNCSVFSVKPGSSTQANAKFEGDEAYNQFMTIPV
jgi:hypothetical protein